jgi:hypothetical protein
LHQEKGFVMKLFFRVTVLTLTAACLLFGKSDKNFPALGTNDIPGGKILQEKYFDGNALWGHIDGGADLYLEYGFDKLLFQEIEWNGYKFRVEYYRMKDAEAAYGIYSVSRFKCKYADTLSKFVCATAYQVQSALGRFYVSIANEKGNAEAEKLGLELFKKVVDKNKDKLFTMPDLFLHGKLALYKSSVKFIKGRLGLQNGFPNWEDLLGELNGYSLYVLPIETQKSFLTAAQITFASPKDVKTFLAKHNITFEKNKTFYKVVENSVSRIYHVIDTAEIVYYETNNEKMLN